MRNLNKAERVLLEAVARKGAHTLAASEREAAVESLRGRGLVEDAFTAATGFQVVRLTELGLRTFEGHEAARSWRDELNALLASMFEERQERVRVLDVGGGRRRSYWLPGNRHLTVCDVDADALIGNSDADQKIANDITLHDFSDRQFDLIVFWDVMEHLAEPLTALLRTVRLLAPDGAILIRGPVASSMQGLVSKYTPHFLHIAFHRYVLDDHNAGRRGWGPYRTIHTREADDRFLIAALREQGLSIIAERRFVGPHPASLREKSEFAYGLFRKLSELICNWTDSRAGDEKSDFFILARRTG